MRTSLFSELIVLRPRPTLGKIDRRVETMDDFRDGVNFILLIGLLDGEGTKFR